MLSMRPRKCRYAIPVPHRPSSSPAIDIISHWTFQAYTCQMASTSVEQFQQGARMRQSDDRQTTLQKMYRKNRRSRLLVVYVIRAGFKYDAALSGGYKLVLRTRLSVTAVYLSRTCACVQWIVAGGLEICLWSADGRRGWLLLSHRSTLLWQSTRRFRRFQWPLQATGHFRRVPPSNFWNSRIVSLTHASPNVVPSYTSYFSVDALHFRVFLCLFVDAWRHKLVGTNATGEISLWLMTYRLSWGGQSKISWFGFILSHFYFDCRGRHLHGRSGSHITFAEMTARDVCYTGVDCSIWQQR